MPTMNGSGHEGKGGGLEVPPGRPQGHGGRKLHAIVNLWEMAMRRRMKMRKKGR
jgi:hypothetical protein